MGIVMCLHRCRNRRARSPWLVLLAAVLAAHATPQGPPPEDSVAAAPADVQFKVETKDGQTTVRIGEVIPLVLSFTSSSAKAYHISTTSSDRSGRLGYEFYAIEPKTGWEDPLKLYFSAWAGWIGGGLQSSGILSDKPTVIRRELNDSVRFTRPGEYRIRVKTGRVGRIGGTLQQAFLLQADEITLNIVEATPEWQQQTLERAAAVVNGPQPAGRSDSDRRKDAMKTLRYLGTKAAGIELARHLNEPELVTDCELGIAGSPVRQEIGAEMRTMLADPDFPVSTMFLVAMSLAGLPTDSAGLLPQEREALVTKYRMELVDALPAKRNEALAVSATTIVEDAAMYGRELPPELKKRTSEALAANFEKLPVPKQAELLQSRWKALDQQTMLPVLRKVAQRYKEPEELRTMDWFNFDSASAAALKHWYALEPAEARKVVIEEMMRPRPRFDAAVLGMLPDKELPEVSQALVERLREPDNTAAARNTASLIHRYADASVLPQVAGYLDESLGKHACAIQDPLLAYLLKQDSAAARPRLERALAARGPADGLCCHCILAGVGKLQNSPLLEELAIPALEDADVRVVSDAAMYLKDYGSAAAEGPLLNRFAAWCKQWRGREPELEFGPDKGMETLNNSMTGSRLMEAVALGQGWLADQTTLQRLVALSIGPQQRLQAEQYLNAWEARPWRIQASGGDPLTISIAQYPTLSLDAANEKLKQFPRGSRIVWHANGEEAERTFAEIAKTAKAAGIEIVRGQQ